MNDSLKSLQYPTAADVSDLGFPWHLLSEMGECMKSENILHDSNLVMFYS